LIFLHYIRRSESGGYNFKDMNGRTTYWSSQKSGDVVAWHVADATAVDAAANDTAADIAWHVADATAVAWHVADATAVAWHVPDATAADANSADATVADATSAAADVAGPAVSAAAVPATLADDVAAGLANATTDDAASHAAVPTGTDDAARHETVLKESLYDEYLKRSCQKKRWSLGCWPASSVDKSYWVVWTKRVKILLTSPILDYLVKLFENFKKTKWIYR